MDDLAPMGIPEQDPQAAARDAGLRYVSDDMPGITRKRAGKGFAYRDPEGRPIRDRAEIRRLKSLAIPPAYTDVWICPYPAGHLQATGRDDRGRKQYRYHPRWREVRDETKYERMLAFGERLPAMRERIDADLRRHGMPREKVLAAVVRLLETTLIRVGNDEYAKDNRSFGLTTMRRRHAEIEGGTIRFRFRGKSGKQQEVTLRDRRLAGVVRKCEELPGQELFSYIDDEGVPRDVGSADVNDYLREIGGEAFTAKDFRTWAGTVLAAMALQEFERFDTKAAAKRNVTQAIEQVAARLGNTPAICRKCYVHPEIVRSYVDGGLVEPLRERIDAALKSELPGLTPEEAAVMAFLRQRLSREAGRAG
ncbi:MAG TPA: DNA topoisomerase IB, partial [Alphaproteobacteria bacterium]|nr:DNA topoisomerase IB [Alphaproteobacteria bacterium]